jgi:hypothetical protein
MIVKSNAPLALLTAAILTLVVAGAVVITILLTEALVLSLQENDEE